MSRIKLIALSVFATFAMGAILASAASAEFSDNNTTCSGAGIATICILLSPSTELLEATGEEKVKFTLETGTESLLEVPNLGLHIECGVIAGTAIALQPEPLIAVPLFDEILIKFSSCTILGTLGTECKVVEPIQTKDLIGELLATEPRHIVIKPEAGTAFWETEI